MEQINENEIYEAVEIGSLTTYTVKTEKTVSELLKELNLSDKYFAILIDGKRAGLDDVIKEGSSIIILPRIAGG
ncbi:MAG: MoaD/ThiS family protein [Promethearchaeota archaeon]